MILLELFEGLGGGTYVDAYQALRKAMRDFVYASLPWLMHRTNSDRFDDELNSIDADDYSDETSERRMDIHRAIIAAYEDLPAPERRVIVEEKIGSLVSLLEASLDRIVSDYVDHYPFGHVMREKTPVVYFELDKANADGSLIDGGGYYDEESICVHVSKAKLMNMLDLEWVRAMNIKFFGEYEVDTGLNGMAREIAETFVHELAHGEQAASFEADPKHGANHAFQGRTKVRDPNEKGRRFTWRNVFNGGTPDQWSEYFGTDHEIEAFAAGAAAEIVADFRQSHDESRYASEFMWQENLNYQIDQTIKSIQSGHGYSSSLESYRTHIRDRIASSSKPARAQAFKAVWQQFLKRLVKHLLLYKKPLDH